MNVPIKRGTARRLGIVRPLPPGVYWAPLPGPRGVAAVNTPMVRGTARRLGIRGSGQRAVLVRITHHTPQGWVGEEMGVVPLAEVRRRFLRSRS